MHTLHIQLGSLIREYRQKENFTQLDLAKKLGYDGTQFVSLFERGLSKIPLETLGQLIVILRGNSEGSRDGRRSRNTPKII